MIERLTAISRGFTHRFPNGNDPFQMLGRLLEECGELAEQVNHFEGTGVKREKHGEPDPAKLAAEIAQVMGAAAAFAVYYGVELEVEEKLETTYSRLQAEGHIDDEDRID
jgi:NTP pyrophosphatase (non-canonical NTP hydrolase)